MVPFSIIQLLVVCKLLILKLFIQDLFLIKVLRIIGRFDLIILFVTYYIDDAINCSIVI
jgi:hypothetical protein